MKAKIADAECHQHRPPKPLSPKQAQRYLTDFRKTLNQEIPAAAEAIRSLTGIIKIRQERVPGRNFGARWIATFSPDLFRALGQVDACAQLFQVLALHRAGHLDVVRLFDTVARMGEQVGQGAIVGDQDQPLARQVEPADREQPVRVCDQVDHARPAGRISRITPRSTTRPPCKTASAVTTRALVM